MKNVFFLGVIICLGFLSCRNTDEPVQQIDQTLNLYIDSAGQDMLNSNIVGSYTNITMNDLNGLLDNAPVNFTNKKDADTVNFIEYLAGAKRVGIDSSGTSKTYESRINLFLTKRINDSTNAVTTDLVRIQYTSTPDLFQISKLWYNDVLEFTKVEGQPNIIKISK